MQTNNLIAPISLNWRDDEVLCMRRGILYKDRTDHKGKLA